MSQLSNPEKAIIYDECLAESDMLQRQISKLKSEYVGNIPPNIELDIQAKQRRIEFLVKKLESLFL